jgi:hypothetical protein
VLDDVMGAGWTWRRPGGGKRFGAVQRELVLLLDSRVVWWCGEHTDECRGGEESGGGEDENGDQNEDKDDEP